MSMYIMCFSCNGPILAAEAKNKMICNNQVAGGLCDECLTNVRSFKVSFARMSAQAKFAPLQFQCLEVFKEESRDPDDEYDTSDTSSEAFTR